MKNSSRMTLLVLGCLALAVPACHSASVRGTGDRSLTATTPRSMTLSRGHSGTLEIGIERDNFNGPVTVSVFQLPRGVESDYSVIRSDMTSATFILSADRSADLVHNQAVGVTVSDPNGRQVTQYVNLTITD